MNSEKTPDLARIQAAFDKASRELLARRTSNGHWIGKLSASALSTATALSAFALHRNAVGRSDQTDTLIRRAADWLLAHQNPDGGWGDTDKSFSNISTTLLVQSALILAGDEVAAKTSRDVSSRMTAYIESQGGIDAIRKRYGDDNTFSVPILTNAALAGLVPWTDVPQLPFERAAAPRCLFRLLNLQVVSYAIPALVAIGQVRFRHVPQPCNPISLFRKFARKRTLRLIETMQPDSGGYLEAAPLTAFVAMSLIDCGHAEHTVVAKALRFLTDTVRPDGSWPIDTNLATWATTLSINALGHETLSKEQLLNEPRTSGRGLIAWLLSCQHRKTHPFTGAAPGGWGWTDLSGAVPDADDTPGALLALAEFWTENPTDEWQDTLNYHILNAVGPGLEWLIGLRNRDGGMPTFCRGWGLLPFDRSSTDLTAHTMRAFLLWRKNIETLNYDDSMLVSTDLKRKLTHAVERMLDFLISMQNADGSWHPLWFGNQHQPGDVNSFYGTARVLRALIEATPEQESIRRGVDWIVRNQNADGGWGGDGKTSSVEETAVTVEALALLPTERADLLDVYHRGLDWLLDAVETDRWTEASPIGLYFAKLWYYEELYPIIFTVGALRAAKNETLKTKSELQPVVAEC